ncbi:MAG TPA: ATP synthase subunit I [Gammaproteobacteria bacterium]|nr:ATP synthase subunit I [Gammaproteobacteria bacterium]
MAGSFTKARQGTFIIVGLQLAVTVLAGVVAALVAGHYAAWSALAGGLINVTASLYMALKLFAGGLSAGPQQWLGRFLVGEAMKLAITVALFIFALVVLKAAFVPLILAYIATYMTYWAGLARISFGQAA